MCRKTVQVSSLAEFVRSVAENCGTRHPIFRGQPDGCLLMPRIGRPPFDSNPLDAEKKMMEEFERRSFLFLEYTPKKEWEWLALAQHHRMPTRLLDWTSNALAALWFAVEQAPKDDKAGAVWVFGFQEEAVVAPRKKDSPYDITQTKVLRPKHIVARIAAQAGCFTVHAYDEDRRRFTPLDEDPSYTDRLTRIVVAGDLFGDMRNQLDRFGVNRSVLFPDMDGLCSYLAWFHSPQEEASRSETTHTTGSKEQRGIGHT